MNGIDAAVQSLTSWGLLRGEEWIRKAHEQSRATHAANWAQGAQKRKTNAQIDRLWGFGWIVGIVALLAFMFTR